MQAVLSNLNSVPGVAGSMICDLEGRILAQAFPAPFDAGALQQAAAVLADGAVGLETATGPIGFVDLRYGEARIIARPTAAGLLLLLCTRALNLQTLMMSVSVASKKLEKLAQGPEVPEAVARASPPAEAGTATQSGAARASGEHADSGKQKKKPKWFPSV